MILLGVVVAVAVAVWGFWHEGENALARAREALAAERRSRR